MPEQECLNKAETKNEARANIREAIELYLAVGPDSMHGHGEPSKVTIEEITD